MHPKVWRVEWLGITAWMLVTSAHAQTFTEVAGAGLVGVQFSAAAWADYDSDGDFDLLLTGRDNSLSPSSRLYTNDGNGLFTVLGAGLVGIEFGAAAWGDYDRDGDVDVILTGQDELETPVAVLYRNDGNGFTSIPTGLAGVENGSVAWGDYDKDGDLDLALSGRLASNVPIARVYRNSGGTFSDAGVGLPGVENSSLAWGDYDNDGDVDLLLTGLDASMTRIARVYSNTAGALSDFGAGLAGIERSAAAWCDYDGDGDLDVTLAGSSGSGNVTKIYRNDGGSSFVDTGAALVGVQGGSIDWGDCDNDGDPDLLITGSDNTLTRMSIIYRNDGVGFTNLGAPLAAVKNSVARWGDFDGDGDLDIVVSGQDGTGMPIAKAYRNESGVANTPPSPPANSTVQLVGTTATFSWSAATDGQTPTAALTYNVRVGSTPGGSEIVSSMADPGTGSRRVVDEGNANQVLSWSVQLPALGTYYWSVQSVDAGYMSSAFTSEQGFSTSFTEAPTAIQGVSLGAVAWGDYDNDEDLDLLVVGVSGGGRSTRLYRNDAGTWVDTGAGFEGVEQGSASWGDCDNDGDLDLLLTGYSTALGRIARIYRNNGGSFSDMGAGLDGVYQSAAAWGDYDNDGDLDALLSGNSNCCGRSTRLYRNNSGSSFTHTTSFEGFEQGTVSWVDHDGDGDLDVFLTGNSNCCGRVARIYRNNGGGNFTDLGSLGVEGIYLSSADWGDFDGDGDPDLLLTGNSSSFGRISRVYRNNGGSSFSDVGAGLEGVDQGMARWGDNDSDGDLDVAITGQTNSSRITRVYRNQGGTFSDTVAGLEPLQLSTLAWGDFDGDRDADLFVTGHDAGSAPVAKLYRSNATNSNQPPSSPAALTVLLSGLNATFSWGAASDDWTPSAGLTYNLRVGLGAGGEQIVPAMADPATGIRRVAAEGNARQRLSWTVRLPQLGTYSWSVQAIDGSYAGSSFASEQIFSTPFSDVGAGIEGVYNSAVAWGDYDNDQDLDLLVAGYSNTYGPITRLYGNQGGSLINVGASFEGVHSASVAWGDYDEDGDLDVLLAGNSNCCGRITRIYRNNAGSFSDIGAGLEGTEQGAVAWGDYDNDGDLDILLSGYSNCCGYITRIYRNNGNNTFSDIGAGLLPTYRSSVAWGDYDSDGDLDILISGYGHYTRVYRNDGGGSFSDIGAPLQGVYDSSVAWGDYDNDGDLDILLTGAGPIARVYRNSAGSFTDIGASIEGVYGGTAAWGDYDNDGDLDALISGYSNSFGPITRVYQNSFGSFSDAGLSLEGTYQSAAAWGDYDNDGDLDLIATGQASQPVARLYRNNVAATPNSPPSVPTGLQVQVVGNRANLSWSQASDSTTPEVALSYNLRIGTSPGGAQIMTPMADSTIGYRRVVRLGPAGSNRFWSLDLSGIPVTSKLHFAAQAIDHGFAGSPFSAEIVFSGAPIIHSVADVGNDQGRQVRIQWQRSIYDAPSSSTVITAYGVWRLINQFKPSAAGAVESHGESAPPRLSMPPGEWDFILTVPARGNSTYNVIAPTLCDSTALGPCNSAFFVSAMTANPTVYFDSELRWGYSIDNLAPSVPQGLLASVLGADEVLLQWILGTDEDLDYYAIYRGVTSGFTPSESNRVGYTTGPNFQDVGIPAGTYFYVITAVDFAGNESPPSAERAVNLLVPSDSPLASARFALQQNRPNPFNPSTRITFEVAEPCNVKLEVFGPDGSRVATLVDRQYPVGLHVVQWNGTDTQGNRLPSGHYLCRILAGRFEATRKMVLLQ